MQKNIHIRSSINKFDACWVRSSKYNNNIFKEFNYSEKGIHELITWLQHGYENNQKKINVIIESFEDSHLLLTKTLSKAGVSVSISKSINKNQLNQYIVSQKKKIQFLSDVISEYEKNLSSNIDNGRFNLSNITLESSINLLKEQLLSAQDKCKTYAKWQLI